MAAARVLAFQDTGEPDIDANTVRLVNGERMSSTNGTGATRMVRLHALCMVMRTDARHPWTFALLSRSMLLTFTRVQQ